MTSLNPALMCPDTINRIRDLAKTLGVAQIGAAIGWDALRVQRVAREWGIEVSGECVPASVIAPPPKTQTWEGVRWRKPKPPPTVIYVADGVLNLFIETCRGEMQRLLMLELRHALPSGRHVTCEEIAREIGSTRESVHATLHLLARRLEAATDWSIDNRRAEGYRLVVSS